MRRATLACELDGRPQSQVRRQWQILVWLTGVRYGLTLDDLATRTKASPRTIRRDLDVLVDAGFPIERNHEGEGIAIRFVWGADVPPNCRQLLCHAIHESQLAKAEGAA